MRNVRGLLPRLTAPILSAVLVAGCAVINPYVQGDSATYRNTPTLEAAIVYAEDTRDQYYGAIRDYALLNRGVGIALIGVAAAGAYLGITDGGRDTIAALGITGAGLFAADSLLNSRPRLRVYAEGAKAVSCGLSIYAPTRAVGPNDLMLLRRGLIKLVSQLSKLNLAIGELREFDNPILETDPEIVEAKSIKTAAEATLQRGRQTRRDLDQAGAKLYAFVNNINDDVTKALIALEPDIAELVANLRTNLTANAGLIVGPLPQKPAVEKAPTHAKATNNPGELIAIAKVVKAAQDVNNTANGIESLIASVNLAVNDLNLTGCENLVQTRPFRVSPQPSLNINTSVVEPAGNVIVSGGTTPYDYSWVGQAPGNGISLAEVPPEQRSAGLFVIQIRAAQNTAAQVGQLLVQDSAEASTLIIVNFSPGSVSPSPPSNESNGVGPLSANPTIQSIQDNLIQLGCLAPSNDNGASNKDGLWGDNTTKAFERFVQDILGGEQGAIDNLGQPNTEAFYTQLLDQTRLAVDLNKQCMAEPG